MLCETVIVCNLLNIVFWTVIKEFIKDIVLYNR